MPSDLAVVMAMLKQERKERISVPVAPSTFSDDVASIHGRRLVPVRACLIMLDVGNNYNSPQNRSWSTCPLKPPACASV